MSEYNLEERTVCFGEKIVGLCKAVGQDVVSRPIISQLVRSGTSVGANYMEANGASSYKDFRNKIYICKKEIQETKHWLRIALSVAPEKKEEILNLSKECQELILIFSKIVSSIKLKMNKIEN